MTDFRDSPSGLDPKGQKPWSELTEVEHLEYHDLIKRRMNNRIQEAIYQRSLAEESLQKSNQTIAIAVLVTFILFALYTNFIK